MLKSNIIRHLILTAALLATTAAHAFAHEAELLRVLRSDATLQEKSAACRQLARIATKDAIPTLAALLGDEKLSHMARYALEPIQDSSVDEALRDALGKVQGPARLGVIGSLGARRDAESVLASKGINRAELGRALAQAGHTPVELEIIKAEYGVGTKIKDVTAILRKYAKNYRIIFLPSASYNESLLILA